MDDIPLPLYNGKKAPGKSFFKSRYIPIACTGFLLPFSAFGLSHKEEQLRQIKHKVGFQ